MDSTYCEETFCTLVQSAGCGACSEMLEISCCAAICCMAKQNVCKRVIKEEEKKV